jgi:hypothetical protein
MTCRPKGRFRRSGLKPGRVSIAQEAGLTPGPHARHPTLANSRESKIDPGSRHPQFATVVVIFVARGQGRHKAQLGRLGESSP